MKVDLDYVFRKIGYVHLPILMSAIVHFLQSFELYLVHCYHLCSALRYYSIVVYSTTIGIYHPTY